MFIIRAIGCIGMLLCSWGAVGQQRAEKDVLSYVEQIKHFAAHYPREKVYLHFDNTCYYVGDTIWFKAYLVNSIAHQASDWSRTLYVELLNEEGNIIETKRYKTTAGQCHGQLAVRDSLHAGYYEVRAYTRWMMNWEDRDVFSRVFPVFDPVRNAGEYGMSITRPSFKAPDYRIKNFWTQWDKKGERLTVRFYPEGGNLVRGLKSKVAFKATDAAGRNVEVQGTVRDGDGNDLVFFSTQHDGMGAFEFQPEGKTYTAEVRYDNRTYRFALPEVLAEGAVITADQRNAGKLTVGIARSAACRESWLGLTLTCRGKLISSLVLKPSAQSATAVAFLNSDIPAGVSQITLFDTLGCVLAERLIYVRHPRDLTMEVKTDRQQYAPYAPVRLNFTLNDAAGQPVETTFSLSVRDAGTCPEKPQDENIETWLLLSSELKGYVHRPQYYFEQDDRQHRYALDLLMLTQGWSRYVWKQMSGVEPLKVEYPAEETISIDGRVLTYGIRQKPRANVEVLTWMYAGGESYRGKTMTDSAGRFVFARDLWGTWNLSLQVSEEGKRKNSDIRLNRAFSPSARQLAVYEKQFEAEYAADSLCVDSLAPAEEMPETPLLLGRDMHLLDEALVKRKREWKREMPGLKNATVVYHMEPYLDKLIDEGNDNATTIYEFLEQNNPYYRFGKYKGRAVTFVVNNILAEADHTLVLDEMVPEQLELVTIDETYGTACVYAPDDHDCEDKVTIFLYTNPGNQIRRAPRGIRQTKLEGYARVKEFYAPDYSKGVLPGETDYRRTLYWNPNVKTDSLGKAEVHFYNNTAGRRFNISAETVTTDGKVGRLHTPAGSHF